MPPKITRVRWSAKNIPFGLEFNENTGIFTGTPEDAGEYVVPVTVETNYGTDTKNVVINVSSPEPPTQLYGVYTIGAKAKTWSSGTTPDEYGFYCFAIPNMEKLSSWDSGFRAYANGGNIYGCGVKGYFKGWEYDNIVTKIENFSSASPIECFCTIYGATGSNTEGTTGVYIRATISTNGKIKINNNTYHMINGAQYNASLKAPSLGEMYGLNLSYSPMLARSVRMGNTTKPIGMRWISLEDRTLVHSVDYSINTSTRTVTATLNTKNLGYKAKKIISPYATSTAGFHILSEDGLLDNNPNNFPYGVIKDAWGYSSTYRTSSGSYLDTIKAYVQTVDNQFYEYMSSANTWNLLGTYDIKKAFPSDDIFLLTNDGKLYHKGRAISNLFTVKHETLTHIFPTLTFKDFIFSGSTLVVLRE